MGVLNIRVKFIMVGLIGWDYKMLKFLVGYLLLLGTHIQIQ